MRTIYYYLVSMAFCAHFSYADCQGGFDDTAIIKKHLMDRGVKGVSSAMGNIAHMNIAVAPQFRDLYANSIGFIYQTQPQHDYDHGLIRVRHTMMDSDEPMARYFGELHQTGLSGFDVYENTKRHLDNPEVRIEAVIPLSPEQLDVADFYHRVRRAAIVRVMSQFNKKFDYKSAFNVVTGLSEQCFTFSWGHGVTKIADFSKATLQNSLGLSWEQLLARGDVQTFLKKSRAYILGLNITLADINQDAAYLAPNLVMHQDAQGRSLADELNNLLGAANPTTIQITANWLLTAKAASDYAGLLRQLGFLGGSEQVYLASPHTKLIVVHDTTPQSVAMFAQAKYQTQGRGINFAPKNQVIWK